MHIFWKKKSFEKKKKGTPKDEFVSGTSVRLLSNAGSLRQSGPRILIHNAVYFVM
jgi:hypothetical protein